MPTASEPEPDRPLGLGRRTTPAIASDRSLVVRYVTASDSSNLKHRGALPAGCVPSVDKRFRLGPNLSLDAVMPTGRCRSTPTGYAGPWRIAPNMCTIDCMVAQADLVALHRSTAMLSPDAPTAVSRDVLLEVLDELIAARALIHRLGTDLRDVARRAT